MYQLVQEKKSIQQFETIKKSKIIYRSWNVNVIGYSDQLIWILKKLFCCCDNDLRILLIEELCVLTDVRLGEALEIADWTERITNLFSFLSTLIFGILQSEDDVESVRTCTSLASVELTKRPIMINMWCNIFEVQMVPEIMQSWSYWLPEGDQCLQFLQAVLWINESAVYILHERTCFFSMIVICNGLSSYGYDLYFSATWRMHYTMKVPNFLFQYFALCELWKGHVISISNINYKYNYDPKGIDSFGLC